MVDRRRAGRPRRAVAGRPGELGDALAALEWYWWDAGEPRLGWELQLAVADPAEGYAWAISAHDAA